jgi:hypothetical protein
MRREVAHEQVYFVNDNFSFVRAARSEFLNCLDQFHPQLSEPTRYFLKGVGLTDRRMKQKQRRG